MTAQRPISATPAPGAAPAFAPGVLVRHSRTRRRRTPWHSLAAALALAAATAAGTWAILVWGGLV